MKKYRKITPNSKKGYWLTSRGFDIQLRDSRWLRFEISHHARERSLERKISLQSMATTVLRVRDHLAEAIASKGQHPEVAIADHGSGAALIIALEANGGKIITVLEYPLMIVPDDPRIIDHRIKPGTCLLPMKNGALQSSPA